MKKLLVKLCTCVCFSMMFGAVLMGCGEDKKGISTSELSGTWEAEDGIAVYQFSEAGTGSAYTKKNPDVKVTFTYTIGDDAVTIQQTGKETKTDLTISEEDGTTVLYNTNKHNEKVVKVG